MPYQTKAQWEPVINLVEDAMAVNRRIINAIEYGKSTPKYLQEDGPSYEMNLSAAMISALRQEFLAKATAARDALSTALA